LPAESAQPRYWLRSCLAILPAVAVAAYAAFVPLAPADRVIAVTVAANLAVIACFVVLPLAIRAPKNALGQVPSSLLAVGMTAVDATEVVDELDELLRTANLADRLLVVLRDAQGQLVLHGGDESDGEILVEWHGELTGSDGSALAALGRSLGCDRVVALDHGRQLRGVAFVRQLPGVDLPPRAWETLANHLSFLLINRRLTAALERVPASLATATSLQHALMPSPGTVRTAGILHHSVVRLTANCGGDTWTLRELGEGCLLVFIADATGHGPAAAVLSVAVKGVVDGLAMTLGTSLRLKELFAAVDSTVRRIGQQRYIMSALAMIIDLGENTVTIANAGHPRPFLMVPTDRAAPIRQVETGVGSLLGTGAQLPEVRTFTAEPGTRWVLYTDGISEASVPMGPHFGHRRFRDALARAQDGLVQDVARSVFADVDQHTRNRPLDDDAVLVVVEIPREGHAAQEVWRTPPPTFRRKTS
jgi:serine phosphatase RsbU (regulator of sigma subunit)